MDRALGTMAGDGVAALLDALPDATVVLRADGEIVAVNRAWRMFSLDNGGDPATTGIGVNYLDVCRRSAAAGCADAAEVEVALRAVLAGGTVETEFEYPCPSPAVGRWFLLRITPIAGAEPGLLIGHVNVSRRKAAEQDLERRASVDPLTGLANRASFTRKLRTALTRRPGRSSAADVGVLFLDLDGFKPVNDTFGHSAGDEVLMAVAARMAEQTRPHDTVARLGGDEFAVIAPRISEEGLLGLVQRLEAALGAPHLVHGRLVEVGASIGVYHATPGEDPEACVELADEAMYVVKRRRHRAP